jgi:hypothetical protein
VNSYYQKNVNTPGSCEFADTAIITTTDPSKSSSDFNSGFSAFVRMEISQSYERYFCICTANRGLSGLVKD